MKSCKSELKSILVQYFPDLKNLAFKLKQEREIFSIYKSGFARFEANGVSYCVWIAINIKTNTIDNFSVHISNWSGNEFGMSYTTWCWNAQGQSELVWFNYYGETIKFNANFFNWFLNGITQ